MSPPPRIMFDDGSRIMQDDDGEHAIADGEPSSYSTSARGSVPLRAYYEVDRVAREVVDKLDWSETTSRGRLSRLVVECTTTTNNAASKSNAGSDGKNEVAALEDDGFLCRVALQFPDELLADAPDVSWLMEEAVTIAYKNKLMAPLMSEDLRANSDNLSETSQQSLLSNDSRVKIEAHLSQSPLIFILGDTTYGSCCPDEVSANHLNANLIVHYGYACLSPTESVPVVYAFGVSDIGKVDDDDNVWKECVNLVSDEACQENTIGEQLEDALDHMTMEQTKKKLLILYEVRYHHSMNDLKREFDKTSKFQVVVGMIPKQQLSMSTLNTIHNQGSGCGSGGSGGCGGGGCASDAQQASSSSSSTACCATEGPDSTEGAQAVQSCCATDTSSCYADTGGSPGCDIADPAPRIDKAATDEVHQVQKQFIPRTIGGLEIPDNLDLSQHTLLYIGDDLNIDSHEGNARTRLLHILLRSGAPDGPPSIWSYSPSNRRLITDVLNSPLSPTNSTPLSSVLSRTLRRRYFLLNKAKLATTIAILIGTTSNSYSFRRLLSRTRRRIQSTGRTAYTFAVGKLSSSSSKLSNFAEIDCFVLIACGESIAKFWQMEREEMLVPVLTPLELDVALGFREWDGRYSTDYGDLVRWDEADGVIDDGGVGDDDCNQLRGTKQSGKDNGDIGSNSSSDEDDEPFFSMISGKYEQSRTASKQSDLEALPGQGKLIEYRSEAAEFLKQREYKGLEANVGETDAKAAVLGQVGIASNYGEKLKK